MFCGQGIIQENINLSPGYFRLTFLAPEVAALAKPGQFIQIRVNAPASNDPLLARPISIFRIDKEKGAISLIYKVVGRGTSRLSGLNTGDLAEITGPIGNGFEISGNTRNLALIAGGVGMPPLFCLAQCLTQNNNVCKISLFYGGRNNNDLLEMDLWAQTKVIIFTATEDGSKGHRGLVTEIFLTEHQREKFDFIAACGPQPMLQAVQRIALAEAIDGQLSLEAHMACGVGACLGCTCKTNLGYKRVCVDGPVFPIREVIWT